MEIAVGIAIAVAVAVALRTPLVLVTDEELIWLARHNAGYRFEREHDGTVIVRVSYTNGGAKRGEAFAQLRDFAQRGGGKAFDSNAGFAIGPGQSVRAPDASWVSQARVDKLSVSERSKFWPISPNIAIDVNSEGDDFCAAVAKSALFVERGSNYAVAINPTTREVVKLGMAPEGLSLDFDAIIDA